MTNKDAVDIILESRTNRSGVRIRHLLGNYKFLSPTVDVPKDSYYGTGLGSSPERGGIGGDGITKRPIEEVESHIPGIRKRLESETGKIAFLGNGFSNVPLRYAKLFRKGQIKHPPIVADMFDYIHFLDDLLHLQESYTSAQIAFPFEDILKTVREIVELSYINCIGLVTYFFGGKAPPKELCGAQLAINCWGPPYSSLEEQLSILSKGGELYNNFWIGKREGYQVNPLKDMAGKELAWSIKKL